jgi:hypothetical protein
VSSLRAPTGLCWCCMEPELGWGSVVSFFLRRRRGSVGRPRLDGLLLSRRGSMVRAGPGDEAAAWTGQRVRGRIARAGCLPFFTGTTRERVRWVRSLGSSLRVRGAFGGANQSLGPLFPFFGDASHRRGARVPLILVRQRGASEELVSLFTDIRAARERDARARCLPASSAHARGGALRVTNLFYRRVSPGRRSPPPGRLRGRASDARCRTVAPWVAHGEGRCVAVPMHRREPGSRGVAPMHVAGGGPGAAHEHCTRGQRRGRRLERAAIAGVRCSEKCRRRARHAANSASSPMWPLGPAPRGRCPCAACDR